MKPNYEYSQIIPQTDLSLDEITQRIIDAILNERFISQVKLYDIIRPNLAIWIKQQNKIKIPKANLSQLQKTVEIRGIEKDYWRSRVINMVGKRNMQEHYDKLNELLKSEGYEN